MSTSDTKNTHLYITVQTRWIRPVDGCLSQYVSFGKSRARLQEAIDYAVEQMATDSNVYEAVVIYSLTDRDREALAFPECRDVDEEAGA